MDNQTVDECMVDYEKVENAYLASTLAFRYASVNQKISVGIIYSLIFIFGISSNLCTCIVIRKNKFLHNPTNFYLFNLAVSDILIILFGLPMELFQTFTQIYPWTFGNFSCHLYNFLREMMPIVSILTIMGFSTERYVAICHPLKAQILSCHKRSIGLIVLSWSIAAIFTLPMGVISKPNYTMPALNYSSVYNFSSSSMTTTYASMKVDINCFADRDLFDAWLSQVTDKSQMINSLICEPGAEYFDYVNLHVRISAFAFFFVPLILILVLYVMIAIKLVRGNKFCDNMVNTEKQSQSRRGVVRMLGAVVVAFFVSWAPYHLQRLLSHALAESDNAAHHTFLVVLFYLSGSLYLVSSVLNPILYNLMSVKYRRAFVQTLCCCDEARRQHNPLGQSLSNQYGSRILNRCDEGLRNSRNDLRAMSIAYCHDSPNRVTDRLLSSDVTGPSDKKNKRVSLPACRSSHGIPNGEVIIHLRESSNREIA